MSKRIDRGVGNINDFSDDVLGHIISFLPTKDAVRTSVLSARWMNLFALISNLDLEVNTNNVEEGKRFMSIVDRLMFHLDMPSVLRFRLRCDGSVFGMEETKRVGDWMCSLVQRKVQELDIRIGNGAYNRVFLPPMLFSCESLVVLKLNLHCSDKNMENIHDRISLPNLKILRFWGSHFSNEYFIENLLSSCPVLEDLELSLCFFIGSSVRFNVSNLNLKTLTIKEILSTGGSKTTILINAPILASLSYHLSLNYSLEFIDVKSLSKATITTSHSSIPIKFLATTLDPISWIQNIEALTIDFFIVRDLQRSKVPIPLFEKMKYVKIRFQECCYDLIGFDPVGLEYFLARCLVLETLVFEESRMLNLQSTNKRYSLQESQLAPLLCHLKTIEIQLDIGHMILLIKVIKFFLENAKVLEVLKIKSKQGSQEEQLKITRRIMNYPRASKKCSILFLFGTSK